MLRTLFMQWPRSVNLLLLTLVGWLLATTAPSFSEEGRRIRWSQYVSHSLDTLIARGTDHYGEVHSPMLMSVLDVHTLESPPEPEEYGSLVRLEGRLHRRGERGSNLWNDQPTLRAMYLLSQLTEDPQYRKAADKYIAYTFEHCQSPKNLLYWGSHVHWDCFKDRPGGDRNGQGPHEILINHAQWEEMYRIAPQAVQEEIDAIWQWHVHDKKTGEHNRHDDNAPGRDFSFSGGSFLTAFAFMHQATGEEHYLKKAKLVADWHYQHRDPTTHLPPEAPCLANQKDGLYGRTFMNSITGPHTAALLYAYELTGDQHFLDIAVSNLKAYDKYGWDNSLKTYLGMLNLDGTPTTIEDVPATMRSQVVGYSPGDPDPEYSVPPIGPVVVWQTTIYPLEFPIASAQSAIYAYNLIEKEGGPEEKVLLRSAKRWAKVIEEHLPPIAGRTFHNTLRQKLPGLDKLGGTYAGNYGRAISFYVHLYRATDNQKYLDLATRLAKDAVEKLYVEKTFTERDGTSTTYGLFRGHPAKPYYEAVDGVGLLLVALLELDHPELQLGWAF